jgi:hypothetical protein
MQRVQALRRLRILPAAAMQAMAMPAGTDD